MCNYCNREHTGLNKLCWIAHPELMPDSERRKRAAWNAPQATVAARTNVTTGTSSCAIHEQDTDDAKDDMYSHHIFTTVATSMSISPSILEKAVQDATYKQRFCYNTAANRHVFNDRSKFTSLVHTNNNIHGSTSSTTA
jgi:hypothetical protein